MSIERKQILQRACDYLAQREHSRTELKHKLKKLCEDETLLDELLGLLKQEGLQNDERFAEQFITHRSRKGQGPLKIRQELKQKGVDDALINAFLYEGQHDWYSLVREVRQKRFGDALPGDLKNKAKQSRFLYGRGFDSDMIQYAFEKEEV